MVHLSFHQQMTNKLRLVSPAANECGRMASPDSGKASDFNVSKAKYARRRRFEVRRLKSLYQQNDELAGGNLETHSGEDRCAKKRQLENKEIASHASKHEDCPEKQAWETSSSSSSSSSSDHSLENDVVPVRTSSSKSVTCLSHGSVSVIGRRREMEDAITVKQGFVTGDSREYDFFGVYDGHGGSRVAHACREQLHQVVAREIDEWVKTTSSWGRRDGDQIDWERLMVASFGKMDEEVNSKRFEEVKTVGSTAVVAVVGKEEVVVANCGDCRAVLCRGGVAVPLSNDHKPDRPDELERIEAAGGRVINWNGQRVLGVLATSRSIGDQYLKPFVISVPEVTVSKRTETDEFLILASDGLWDVISNEIACKVVRRCLTGRMRRRPQEFVNEKISHELVNYSRAVEAAAVLTELAMAKGSKDNISVIVVELKKLSNLKFHPSVQL